ncbi:membrane protein insertion efficiency factor YidD [Hoyosella rhizosphaerae]|uniref:membrane protein insertion efficiency factor YidD n=1 Tax=Hoyosella rhizosphaerae TaxID=1755582 RepID=UPI0035582565
MRQFFLFLRQIPSRILIWCVQFYRTWISPYRLPTCRFSPTCSEYAAEALQQHGAAKGAFLAIVRLAKCGPWHKGGWDPVPERNAPTRHTPRYAREASDEVNRST